MIGYVEFVYVTHVLDDAFETGYLVGKTEVVEGAGIKSGCCLHGY